MLNITPPSPPSANRRRPNECRLAVPLECAPQWNVVEHHKRTFSHSSYRSVAAVVVHNNCLYLARDDDLVLDVALKRRRDYDDDPKRPDFGILYVHIHREAEGHIIYDRDLLNEMRSKETLAGLSAPRTKMMMVNTGNPFFGGRAGSHDGP